MKAARRLANVRCGIGIALHTTPGVPEVMYLVIALTTADAEMDTPALTYGQYVLATREAIVAAFPTWPFLLGHSLLPLQRCWPP